MKDKKDKLTLRQLEIFLNVVKEGHLTNVAKAMGLSQSAISMAIKELEKILGNPLFDRINKKLVLNEIFSNISDINHLNANKRWFEFHEANVIPEEVTFL